MAKASEHFQTTKKPFVVHLTEVFKEFENKSTENSTENSQNEEIQTENTETVIIDSQLEKDIIQVISSGKVENIYCLENVKQEFVTISEGSVEVSSAQIECYQDLNAIYAEDFVQGASYTVHTCDVCGKGFRKKSNLVRHYRSHTGDNPHACAQCNAAFPTRSRLKEHELTHTGVRPHICGVCGKSFSRVSNLTRHLRTHSEEKPYQCDRCGGRFLEPTRLREHYLTHVGDKRFGCGTCGKSFLKKFNLKRHERTHAGLAAHSCSECGKKFSKRINLLLHMETHGRQVSSLEADSAIETVASNCVVECDPVTYLDDSSVVANENQENKIFSCSDCGKNYLKERNLISHMRRHKAEGSKCKTPLKCNLCEVTFNHGSHLREHMVTHSGIKQYSCALCHRSFGRNSNLLRHLQTHTGDKRFTCEVCGRWFGNNSRLKEHLATHTGEMLHSCKECGRNFRHRCGLYRHLILHTGEKPHKCTTCGKRFNRRGRLATHHKRHHGTEVPKFPNRVEPRLMNIIQNLEARVGSVGESGEDNLPNGMKNSRSDDDKNYNSETDDSMEDQTANEKFRRKTRRKTGISKKNKRKNKHSDSNYSSEELEELTVTVTPSTHNLRSRTLPKRTTRTSSKTSTTTKCPRNELKKRQMDNSTLNKVLSSLSSSKRTVVTNTSPKGLDENKSVENLEVVEKVSEQIEIEDISGYQTQIVGNDLDTFVLIKAVS